MHTQTLMLDQGYAPVKVIPWQRAVQLLFLGKCEVVEEYEDEVRSTKLVIKIPAVVRLLRGFRRHRKPVKFSRVNIYARDDYRCQYCGVRQTLGELTYDHVMPRSRGGLTEWANIVTACQACNRRKANRTPAEAKMTLRKQPKQPVDVPAIVVEVSRSSAPEAWRDYLYWTGELDGD
jgi:5-methylcytosine-specific restriction endonuclease McrA